MFFDQSLTGVSDWTVEFVPLAICGLSPACGRFFALDAREVLLKSSVFAQIGKIIILLKVFEIIIATINRLLKSAEGLINIVEKRVAAGQIVKDDRVLGF